MSACLLPRNSPGPPDGQIWVTLCASSGILGSRGPGNVSTVPVAAGGTSQAVSRWQTGFSQCRGQPCCNRPNNPTAPVPFRPCAPPATRRCCRSGRRDMSRSPKRTSPPLCAGLADWRKFSATGTTRKQVRPQRRQPIRIFRAETARSSFSAAATASKRMRASAIAIRLRRAQSPSPLTGSSSERPSLVSSYSTRGGMVG